jgi:uncharacterized sporulation protein YeaH/YhbH (DUF444 family)
MQLIDRRLNGRNRSAVNRARFVRRYKAQIREAVQRSMNDRSIRDIDRGGTVGVPIRDIAEPSFRHGAGGDREIVHSGNREFVAGDRLPRPPSGGGGGGSEAGEGESVDDFVFTLSRDEFLSIFFDDLELPRLARTYLGDTEQTKPVRAGYVTSGSPSNLAVVRTMRTALGRRMALTSSIRGNLDEAEERLARALAAGDDAAADAIRAEVAELERRLSWVPFLDDIDLRYRNRVTVPAPTTRAVMLCLMDVSASMDENKKDLAKRFFTLLYLFLTRKYRQVELVFIRHTDDAEEVDEHTFFNDTKSGGTVILTALELAAKLITERYAGATWNVYVAQASDGDAFGADAGKSARFLREVLLPLSRYYAYVEVPDSADGRASSLWAEYEALAEGVEHFAVRKVTRRDEIYPVFRELFRREGVAT